MDDLQEEHEMNKYLLQQEKDLRHRLESLKSNVIKSMSQPNIKANQLEFKEDLLFSPKPSAQPKPIEKLDNLDDITKKERQLQEQLEQLRALKKQMKEN
jgi:hypothetical protein